LIHVLIYALIHLWTIS